MQYIEYIHPGTNQESKVGFKIEIAPTDVNAEADIDLNDKAARDRYFNYALGHALRTAWMAKTLNLLNMEQEVVPSSLISELTGKRTFILSGSKMHGQAIKERMVLGYIENLIAERWSELENWAERAASDNSQAANDAGMRLRYAKREFLLEHGLQEEEVPPVQNLPLPDKTERFYIALWERLHDMQAAAPTSGSYGISWFQIVRHLRTTNVEFTLNTPSDSSAAEKCSLRLFTNVEAGARAFVPDPALNIMPMEKDRTLHTHRHAARCPKEDVQYWSYRAARDPMALLYALSTGGLYAPTNPKTMRELAEMVEFAITPDSLSRPEYAKIKNEEDIRWLREELLYLRANHKWRDKATEEKANGLLEKIEVQRNGGDFDTCIEHPGTVALLNQNTKAVSELEQYISRHIPSHFDLLFSPEGIRALNNLGIKVKHYTKDKELSSTLINGGYFYDVGQEPALRFVITRPVEAGLYGLMVPRLQHLEYLLGVNERRAQKNEPPLKTMTTYNQPSVGATFAGAALTDLIMNTDVTLTPENYTLLKELFPRLAQRFGDEKTRTGQGYPIKLRLISTPDTAALGDDSLVRQGLGYSGPSYGNDGKAKNGLGTLSAGGLPQKVIELCMRSPQSSLLPKPVAQAAGDDPFKPTNVVPAPDLLMEIGCLFMFASDVHTRVVRARKAALANGLKEDDKDYHMEIEKAAEQTRYPEDAAAASFAGMLLGEINKLYQNPQLSTANKNKNIVDYARLCARKLFKYGVDKESMYKLLPKDEMDLLKEYATQHGEPLPLFLAAFNKEMGYLSDNLQKENDPAFIAKYSTFSPEVTASIVATVNHARKQALDAIRKEPTVSIDKINAITLYDTGRNGPEVSLRISRTIKKIVENLEHSGMSVAPKGTAAHETLSGGNATPPRPSRWQPIHAVGAHTGKLAQRQSVEEESMHL